MCTVTRLVAVGALISAVFGAWWLRSVQAADGVAIRPDVEVIGATSEQLALARWAVERFEEAGLRLPALKVAFHADMGECEGHMGWARSGRVDVCTVLANEMTRRTLLHEMSHIWLDHNVRGETRIALLRERGVSSWNSSRDPWELRGYEQGAEILAWALGDRILTPQIPNDGPVQIAAAYELMTGRRFQSAAGGRAPAAGFELTRRVVWRNPDFHRNARPSQGVHGSRCAT